MEFLESLGQWKLPTVISVSVSAGMLLILFMLWMMRTFDPSKQSQFPEYCQTILCSLSRPKEWLVDEFCVSHKDGKLSIWIANGYSRFRVYRPFEQLFPEPAKRHIFNAVAKMKQKKITQMLEDS